jgi:hypothetical protein
LFLFICDIAQGTRTDGIEQDFFDRLTKIAVWIQESQRHGVGTASSPQNIALLRPYGDEAVPAPFLNPLSENRVHDKILRCRINAAFRSQVERRIYTAEWVREEICPARAKTNPCQKNIATQSLSR